MNTEPLLIQAYRGQKTSRPPVWFMRQAGRFLPEYREVRSQHSMLEVIRTPQLASKVSLQPIERFGLDAAIIFADILNPLIGMGIELDFVEGEGPRIFNPIVTAEDVERLVVPDPRDNVAYTLEAIELTAQKLRGSNTPVIGFSGAPFTLSSYLIEGRGTTKFDKVKRFMLEYEWAWHALQRKLVTLVSDYLVAQVAAGARAVQLFDSWVGCLGPEEFTRFVAPYLVQIITNVKQATNQPLVYFGPGSAGYLELIGELGMDVVGIDWRSALTSADRRLGGRFPLQGNLDPTLLLGPWSYLAESALNIIDQGRTLKSHIFNLGHGILPETPIGNVEKLVRLIQEQR